jgi:outer membrane protein OmpA-like peptidoglycan-associated protein
MAMLKKLLVLLFVVVSFVASAQLSTSVYFKFNRYDLTERAVEALDSLINPKIGTIKIYGHCDQLGTKKYNYKLSEKRANAVKKYLVLQGFEPLNIKVIKGLGEDQPLTNKLDRVSRKVNRRVTVIGVSAAISADTSKAIIETISPAIDLPLLVAKKTEKKEKLVDEVKDTATKLGKNIILKNINFYGGSHRFLPLAYEPLNDLLNAMEKIPALEIEIQGHVCCTEGEQDGWDYDANEPFLSYNRAKAVYYYLIRNGIDKSRMSYKGFSRRYPIFESELTEAERTTNRRVEIKILKK